MKFEEVLPSLREGKKIKRRSENGYYVKANNVILDENSRTTCLTSFPLLADDWEIVEELKKKVKYYPALVKENEYFISYNKFKNEEEAKKYFISYIIFIRLVTEIPELIVEREE